jgi:hypothetical protein
MVVETAACGGTFAPRFKAIPDGTSLITSITSADKGEPDAIESCFSSRICSLSFKSRAGPKSSSSLPCRSGTTEN